MRIMILQARLCYGGAERVGVALANGFSKRGNSVTMVANLFEPQTYQLDENIVLKNLVATNKNKLKKWLSSFLFVRKYLKEIRPDVIIGIMGTTALVARISSLGLGIPVIMTEHWAFEMPPEHPFSVKEYFFKFYANKIYRSVTVLTEADKKVIGKKLKNVVVMPNPLTLEPANGVPKKKKVILAAGRLTAWEVKGFDVLIKAWGTIAKKYPDWTLQIAGQGEKDDEQRLLDWAADCDVRKQFKLLGFCNNIKNLYSESEIFVLSSRYEGFGLVLIEAMSQGCACVACDYKGRQAEILSPSGDERRKTKDEKSGIEVTENGILCEPENVDALAEGIEKMICDEEYRRNAQWNAIKRSKYYSLENTMDRWESMLNKILEQK